MKNHDANDPIAMSARLRALALTQKPEDIGFTPRASGQNVFCVLMETGMEKAVFTMVCFFDGSTSLYFSSGGGAIGCGEHASVAAAAKAFVSLAETYAERLPAITGLALPKTGMVRFIVRTPAGMLGAEARERDLGEKRNQLWPLFFSGHLVITRIRELKLL